MSGIPDQLLLGTFSARLHGRLVVWVGRPDVDVSDADWEQCVRWMLAIQQSLGELKVLTTPGGRAPSTRQRGMLNRELDADRIRVAVMIADPKMAAIARVTSWFIRGVAAFKPDELEQALAHLRETDTAGVRVVIRDLGGSLARVAQ